MKEFDLHIGNIVKAPEIDKYDQTEKDETGKNRRKLSSRYEVTGIYKYMFTAKKLTGSKREIGFAKSRYQIGEIIKCV